MIDPLASAPNRLRALKRRDFSFFGFEDLMREVDQELRHVEIRRGDPQVSVIADVVYLPEAQDGSARARRAELARGLVESSCTPYERKVDQEVVYLGWLFDHYGHFLMQSLARAWYLPEVAPSVKVVFHAPSRLRWEPTPSALRILQAFGIPLERIMIPEEPTRLRRVIIPEPLFEPRSVAHDQVVRAHKGMARPYQKVAERIASDANPSAQPVYLSRRRLSPSQRTIVDEGELEGVLQDNGFRIAHAETMTFQDQVRLVNEHADVVSNAGSAAHNVLFALHRPRLHLLTNGCQFSPDYFLYDIISGSPTTFVNCLDTCGRPAFETGRNRTPLLLEMPKLLEYLGRRGLLTRPVPVWSDEHRAALRVRYDEAWLYGYVRATGRRHTLPAEVEQAALTRASSSWPISLALAHYYARRDVRRVDGLVRQFDELATVERDTDRFAHYRAEVAEIAPVVCKACAPDTAANLTDVATVRFHVPPNG